MLSQNLKNTFDTGVMGLNIGGYQERKQKLAEERRQEYNRMIAGQGVERERRVTLVPTQVVRQRDPPPLPKRPPSSISAFGQRSQYKPSNLSNFAPDLFKTPSFSSNAYSTVNSVSGNLGVDTNGLTGALDQLKNIWDPSGPSSMNLPPPRYSSSASATLTNYEPPPLQSLLQQPILNDRTPSFSAPITNNFYSSDFSDNRNDFQPQLNDNRNRSVSKSSVTSNSSYRPSAYDETPRKRGEGVPSKENKDEDYNPWGKGGAGAPVRDAGGNVISSRSYRHAGHQNVDPYISSHDNYYEELRKQIMDNKRRAESNQQNMMAEDQKIDKRAEVQAGRMKREYEAEQQRHRRKEEELRNKQEMMRNIQEQQVIEDRKKKKELDERRRIGRENMERGTSAAYYDANRIKSPVIPTLRDKNHGLDSAEDFYADTIRNGDDEKSSREALNALSSARQQLEHRQQELQRDIEVQKRRYQEARTNTQNIGEDRFSDAEGSFLKSAVRIRGNQDHQSSDEDIRSEVRERMRMMDKLA